MLKNYDINHYALNFLIIFEESSKIWLKHNKYHKIDLRQNCHK